MTPSARCRETRPPLRIKPMNAARMTRIGPPIPILAGAALAGAAVGGAPTETVHAAPAGDGWTTSVAVSSAVVGMPMTFTVTASSDQTMRALVDLEVYAPDAVGWHRSVQQVWDDQ